MSEQKLEEAVARYCSGDWYPFHMPGHKRQIPSGTRDITEIPGFDNLHHPEGILLEEMQGAAAFYGTKQTFFSINGSSGALLAAVSAAVRRGGILWMERTSHISVYHAAALRDLTVRYLEHGCGVRPSGAEEGEVPDAILMTSPSYEGVVKDVAGYAAWAHALGAVLIVDEAHGAHFSMHPYFPESAVREGADVVVQSLHKTLPALTQTALLHCVSGRVSAERLGRWLDVYETTSPSYVLLSSITACLHFLYERREEAFSAYAARLRALRRQLEDLRTLALAGGAEAVVRRRDLLPGAAAGMRMDPGKIVVFTNGCMSGTALSERLRGTYHLEVEMKAPGYVLAMTSVCDTDEGFARLSRALFEIDRACTAPGAKTGRAAALDGRHGCGLRVSEDMRENTGEAAHCGERGPEEAAGGQASLPEVRMKISDALEAPAGAVPLAEAAGRCAADFVCVFPPDSPLIVPGERIPDALPGQIFQLIADGYEVTGIDAGRVRVVS